MSLLKVAGTTASSGTLYVDDVFSTYLYTGNGSTQTITNGIDLAGKGGLVWVKNRSTTFEHILANTISGTSKYLCTNDNVQERNSGGIVVTSFNSNGFAVGSYGANNGNGNTYASWTFRKAAKFFDVVTYTGTGSARTIAHSLGVAPGMIIVKKTNSTGQWCVYHRGLTSAAYTIFLNLTDSQTSDNAVWNSTAPTSSVFTVGDSTGVNASGDTYVAYLFAHDTSATGIIQCGSFTSDGSGNVSQQTLGWQPQYILWKVINTADTWRVFDTMRDWNVSSGTKPCLRPNYEFAETNATTVKPNATGFSGSMPDADGVYIYMAIRMPNKPPTSGTQVFSPVYTSSASNPLAVTTNFPVDASIYTASSISGQVMKLSDRLRGSSYAGTTKYLEVSSTSDEITKSSPAYLGFDSNVSLIDSSFLAGGTNPKIYWSFKRAPGFFDEVCYTGSASTLNVNHNLTVVPELIIAKTRSTTSNWIVYSATLGNAKALLLNGTSGQLSQPSVWNSTTPTSTIVTLGGASQINDAGVTSVMYLFATLAGISKVGSYTGNGSTGQAIACGFSAGARFVLIKRTDDDGNWYTFDSARGLTSVSSPYLLLNSTAAEVTGNNGVYASTGGFTLGSTASTTTNINGASYIYLSVA